MFAKKRRPNIIAEVLERLKDQDRCADDSMASAAAHAVREAMQEGNGLGFLPSVLREAFAELPGRTYQQRLPDYDIPIIIDFFRAEPEPAPTPRRAQRRSRREDPRGSGMPFARDFGTKSKGRRRDAEDQQSAKRAAEERAWREEQAERQRQERADAYGRQHIDPEALEREQKLAQAYVTLGIDKGATQADVKARRRELALRYNSDQHGSEGDEEKLKLVNAAADLIEAHLRG